MVKEHTDRLVLYWSLIDQGAFEPEEEDTFNERNLENAIEIMQRAMEAKKPKGDEKE